MRIVILCDSVPSNPTDGLHLRVQNLVRELAKRNEFFYFGVVGESEDDTVLRELGFSDTCSVDRRPREGRHWMRHLRLSNEKFLQISSPAYFRTVSEAFRESIKRWNPDLLLSFAPALSEIAIGIDVPKLLDYTDCQTLAYRRALDNRRSSMSFPEQMRWHLKIKRQAGRERALLKGYDLTTTISRADRKALLKIAGVPDGRVAVLPNGVAAEALTTGDSANGSDKSVIFWGNLDFPPNWTAVTYFYEKVFLPFLSDQNITWHIVGSGASRKMREDIQHPNICFHGFVDDLYAFAAGKGAMINPMVEGSGMKNKVLEAFALNLPVVSTPMGVEAIEGEENIHFFVADSPRQFALHVQTVLDDDEVRRAMVAAGRELVERRYTWAAIGETYQMLMEAVMSGARGKLQSETR